ncbi:hypothetical protein GCM10027175_18580 [Hymenobacter latericoloratus]
MKTRLPGGKQAGYKQQAGQQQKPRSRVFWGAHSGKELGETMGQRNPPATPKAPHFAVWHVPTYGLAPPNSGAI